MPFQKYQRYSPLGHPNAHLRKKADFWCLGFANNDGKVSAQTSQFVIVVDSNSPDKKAGAGNSHQKLKDPSGQDDCSGVKILTKLGACFAIQGFPDQQAALQAVGALFSDSLLTLNLPCDLANHEDGFAFFNTKAIGQ